MGWGMFWFYFASGVSGISFLYFFYKADFNLHRTELLMLAALRRLPLYWPPGPPAAVVNSLVDAEGLPEDFVAAFCEWFINFDLEEPGGVMRDDVLTLITELGFSEEAKDAKDFLYRGQGMNEERRRLTCVGLQESLTLISKLVKADAKQKDEESEEKKAADAKPKVGPAAVELLRSKIRRTGSVLSGAQTLQQLLPVPATPMPIVSLDKPAESVPKAVARATWEDDVVDESAENELEARRYERLEAELTARLERLGSLTPAEEARLQEARERRARLQAS